MYDYLNDLIDQFESLDFKETPNYCAIVNIAKVLREEYPNGDGDFANSFVVQMDIDVNSLTLEEAAAIGTRWGGLCIKFIDTFLDAGFSFKHIALMANQLSLKASG